MANKYNRGRLYYGRSEESQRLTEEERLACEIYVILDHSMSTALKHAMRLNIKPSSLPAMASRFFKQLHIKSYVDYLQMEQERSTLR